VPERETNRILVLSQPVLRKRQIRGPRGHEIPERLEYVERRDHLVIEQGPTHERLGESLGRLHRDAIVASSAVVVST
jgi:hypothetical protein